MSDPIGRPEPFSEHLLLAESAAHFGLGHGLHLAAIELGDAAVHRSVFVDALMVAGATRLAPYSE